jgi:hypothetical protein
MILPYHQRAINTDYEFLFSKRLANAAGEGIYRGVGKSFDLGGGLYGVSRHSSSQGITEYGVILGIVVVFVF